MPIHLKLLPFLLLLVSCCVAGASAEDQRVEQWGFKEISLRSAVPHANPFTDVEIRCRFSSGKRQVEVYGFYDGSQTWKIRFMPEQQGEWTYATSSNDPELDGKVGTFSVGPPTLNNHGPVRVENTYHFAYADGTVFFPWVQRCTTG